MDLRAGRIFAALSNPSMPRTFGDGLVHQSHVDVMVNVDYPLPELKTEEPNAVERSIGKLIAENLVEDGATLQMGIGHVPNAVLSCLHQHKDLGVHTEMFSDGVVDLVERGCITNAKKNIRPGIIVSSFAMGSRNLFKFINNNPSVGKKFYIIGLNGLMVISEAEDRGIPQQVHLLQELMSPRMSHYQSYGISQWTTCIIDKYF